MRAALHYLMHKAKFKIPSSSEAGYFEWDPREQSIGISMHHTVSIIPHLNATPSTQLVEKSERQGAG